MAGTSGTLRDVQRWLADVILASDAERAGPGPVAAPPRGTIAERLHAYVDGYPARVHEALAEAFPAVAHLVGAAAFADLARRYLPRVPAGVYSLGEVGRALPDFLAADPLGADLPFLADLARLEWAVQRAFHAHLLPPFDAACVAGWTPDDWAEARVRFQAGTACVASAWPIRTLRDAQKTPREEIDVLLEGRPETVVVHRVDLRVACDPIEAGEAIVLGRLLGGATLGDAVADLSPAAAERLGGWTASWVARGLVVACERAGSSRLPG
jgi:hypothetical protein